MYMKKKNDVYANYRLRLVEFLHKSKPTAMTQNKLTWKKRKTNNLTEPAEMAAI